MFPQEHGHVFCTSRAHFCVLCLNHPSGHVLLFCFMDNYRSEMDEELKKINQIEKKVKLQFNFPPVGSAQVCI